MDFLNRIFSREKRIEVREEELEKFLEDKISSTWQEVSDKFEPEKISLSIQKVLEKVEMLNDAQGESGVHNKLAAMSKSAKNNVYVVTKKEMRNIGLGSLKEFYTQAGSALERLGNVTSKYAGLVKISYGTAYSDFWKELRKLYSHYTSVEKFAKKAGIKEKEILANIETLKAHNQTKGEMERLQKQITILGKELENDNAELGKVKKEILELETGEEYVLTKNEVTNLEREIRTAKSEFGQLISQLQTAFYHYKNVTTPENRRIIENKEFRQKPEKTDQILAEMKNKIINEEIVLDDKRKERALNILEKDFKQLFEKMDEQERILLDQKTKNQPILERIRRLEMERESVKHKIENGTREMQTLKQVLNENQTLQDKQKVRITEIKNNLHK